MHHGQTEPLLSNDLEQHLALQPVHLAHYQESAAAAAQRRAGARGRCLCFRKSAGGRCIWLLLMVILVPGVVLGGILFGDVLQGTVLERGHCPMSSNTGRSCKLLQCGDRGGMSTCSSSGMCVCRPGYCAQESFCQLNTTFLKAAVVPVTRAQPTFPGPHAHVRTALCVSGGGSRSMSSTLGALRALEHLGLMDGFDAISSVSGGSWASALYMFANVSKEKLLGDYSRPYRPEELTMKFLDSQRTLLGRAASTPMQNFLADDFNLHSKMQTVWVRYVGRMVLAPANLDRNDAFMAASWEAVERIKRDNPLLRDMPFVVPQPGRPKVFVMNGAILAPAGYQAQSSNVVSMQMSPDYTGSPFYPNNSEVLYPEEFRIGHPFSQYPVSSWVGGGFVETFAFGGAAPQGPQQGGGEAVELPAAQLPFTLANALAISSAAFGKLLAPGADLGLKADPEALIWPVTKQHQDASTYLLGDGGNLENAGILAMLQRGARRIVWLVNTDVGVSYEEPFCKIDAGSISHWDPLHKVTDQVTDKFGFGRNSGSTWLSNNQVFAREELPPLLCELQRLMREGRPAVLRKSHKVLPNSWWGIQGGYTVDVVYVYNEDCRDFVGRLPAETQRLLDLGAAGPFAHYPFYKTTFEDRQFTALTHSQVTLLAALAEYSVLENADEFRKLLAK